MPRPMCVPCAREMNCHQNSFIVHVTASGEPYQIWSSDAWRCPECKHMIVSGFGRSPVAEAHVDPPLAFERWLQRAQLVVS